MSDKYKGFLVSFDKELSDEGMDLLSTVLKCIRNVKSVTPYVKGAEDYMSEQKGYLECYEDIKEVMLKKLLG